MVEHQPNAIEAAECDTQLLHRLYMTSSLTVAQNAEHQDVYGNIIPDVSSKFSRQSLPSPSTYAANSDPKEIIPFICNNHHIGFILIELISHFKEASDIFHYVTEDNGSGSKISPPYLQFQSHLDTFERRSESLASILSRWRKDETFPSLKKGWRDELYPCFGGGNGGSAGCSSGAGEDNQTNAKPKSIHDTNDYDDLGLLFVYERAAHGLLGIRSYGVILNSYGQEENGDYYIWTAIRAKTKAKFPGKRDVLVGGGLAWNMEPSNVSILR